MKNFDLYQPDTFEELLHLMSQQQDYHILAGGTDLLVRWKRGQSSPRNVINLKGIQGLKNISLDQKSLMIGALITVNQLLTNKVIQADYPALAQAAELHSSPQIRQLATVVGNVCNASPAADLIPALLIYNARVQIQSITDTRIVELKDFFAGPGKTVLKAGEVVVGLELPKPDQASRSIFLKEGKRKAHEIAVVNCAVSYQKTDQIQDLQIALGAVGPTPILINELDWFTEVNEETLHRLELLIDKMVSPITDQRSNAWYRRELIKTLVKRAIAQSM